MRRLAKSWQKRLRSSRPPTPTPFSYLLNPTRCQPTDLRDPAEWIIVPGRPYRRSVRGQVARTGWPWFPILFRYRQATDMGASFDPRRYQRRVFARQYPLASCRAVSMAAKRSGECWGLIQIKRCHPTTAKSGSWHQDGDGFPTSKLPGSPPSFSAWRLCSPSSCCPLGERGRQDEQITGDTMKRPGAGLAPLFLSLPTLAGFFDLSHSFDGPLRSGMDEGGLAAHPQG